MNIKKSFVLVFGHPAEEKISHPMDVSPPISLAYISSILSNAGNNISLFDYRRYLLNQSNFFKDIKKFKPDFLVFSFETFQYNLAIKFLKNFKSDFPNSKVILIGQHPSFAPESVLSLKEVDFIIRGEAEGVFEEFLENINSPKDLSKIAGICFDKNISNSLAMVKEPDKLPFPKHDLLVGNFYKNLYPFKYFGKINWGFVITSRGCPHNCLFCSPTIRVTYGKKYRKRSAKNVIDEVEYLLSLGVNFINFLDDEFTLSFDHVRNICTEIKKRNLNFPWMAHARIDELDYKLMKDMKNSGCVLLKIGLESGSNRIINKIKKANKDVDWNKLSKKTFKEAKRAGLDLMPMIILGCPSETKEDINKTKNLLKEIFAPLLQIAFFTPYPGSPIYSNWHKKQEYDEKFHHYVAPEFSKNFSTLTKEELLGIQSEIYKSFYLNPKFLVNHIVSYFPFYLSNPSVFLTLSRFFLGKLVGK